MSQASVVVKVGGSLFDWPDLGPRLDRWLQQRDPQKILLVPGGGPTADVIRVLDKQHGLGEERAHWLALRALTLNAWFLAGLSPTNRLRVVLHLEECNGVWDQAMVPVMDPHAFAVADEGRTGFLPHCWSVTSDSLAARMARVSGASKLVLLKSVSWDQRVNWDKASNSGLVDTYFPQAIRGLERVQAINFRQWQP
jgi:aspartokinase-like uncharacterized kinase